MGSSPPLCPGCVERDQEIVRLKARITDLGSEVLRLRQEIEDLRRDNNRQAARFRRRKLKKRHKKPGRKNGHAADVRPTPTPFDLAPSHSSSDCRAFKAYPKRLALVS